MKAAGREAQASTASQGTHLQRNLTNRHIQLIAIGGAIGTGLFMGSGKTISLAGPSIIFVYMIIGFMLFFVMRAMGELLLSGRAAELVAERRRSAQQIRSTWLKLMYLHHAETAAHPGQVQVYLKAART